MIMTPLRRQLSLVGSALLFIALVLYMLASHSQRFQKTKPDPNPPLPPAAWNGWSNIEKIFVLYHSLKIHLNSPKALTNTPQRRLLVRRLVQSHRTPTQPRLPIRELQTLLSGSNGGIRRILVHVPHHRIQPELYRDVLFCSVGGYDQCVHNAARLGFRT